MRLTGLSDQELHDQTRDLVGRERQIVTRILQHLGEIERRKLFSDHGCSSLFDYAVRKLGYTESQAHRRIQAMRMIKELPAVEQKIADGSLSLSNIAQAQSAFNELKRINQQQPITTTAKAEILSKLEHKSAREGQRELLKLLPKAAMPKERERSITDEVSEVKFVMTAALRAKLEEVRSLLGPKGAQLNYADLFEHMAEICLTGLKAKRFGKKRSQTTASSADESASTAADFTSTTDASAASHAVPTYEPMATSGASSTLSTVAKTEPLSTLQVQPVPHANEVAKSRYISAKIRHEVWQRDGGKCCQCGSKRGLNFDHIIPFAKRGPTTVENLRLLCFQCNQRAAMREFGCEFMSQMALGQ